MINDIKIIFPLCNFYCPLYTSLTFTWVKLCKIPDVNIEPTYFMNNCKAFPSLNNVVPVPWSASVSTTALVDQ